MHTTDEVLKDNEIDQVAREVAARLEGEAGARAAAFTRAYYRPIAPEDIRARGRGELVGAPLNLWLFGRQRQPGEILARVYNPRLEDHGWQSEHTLVELVNDDMPFLVDSVTAALTRRELGLHLVAHPIVHLRRDEAGEVVALVEKEEGGGEGVLAESYIAVELDPISDPLERESLRQELLRVLALVRAAVEDWRAMLEQLGTIAGELRDEPPPVPPEQVEETLAFLDWLRQDHFTFLGYRRYDLTREGGRTLLVPIDDSGLGVLRGRLRIQSAQPRELSPAMIEYSRRPEILFVTKTNNRSLVHRPVHMDYIGLKRYSASGELLGEHRLVGLFTSLSYRRLAVEVPLLRRKIRQVLARAHFDPRSHDGKSLTHILETLPRDELFQMDVEELYETALGVLQLQERQRLALFVRNDLFERFVACTVYVPRDRYNTALRLAMVGILEKAFDGRLGATYTQMGDEPLARLQFFLATTPGAVPDHDVKAIEAALEEASHSWSDDLVQVLREEWGEERGLPLARRYANAFPLAYQEDFEPQAARFDITRLEEVLAGRGLALTLYRPVGGDSARVHFKVYSAGEPRPLSEVVPIFENLGFKVVAERPYEVRPADCDGAVWVRDFELVTRDGAGIEPGEVREPLLATFARVWAGDVEDDAFNLLVLASGLGFREVVVLRACCRYLRQTGIAFSQDYMAHTLARNPRVVRLLIELFRTLFEPDEEGGPEARTEAGTEAGTDREGRAEAILGELRTSLDAVANLDEDRILRRFVNLIRSILRTNYFQLGPDGAPRPYLSFKLDSGKIDELPDPRPLVEIFVYSPRVEAVHLRGGLVARGGIRWSDRPEDFRTEVLGLMKAQMVKNAVIVPVGSKGGFVVKRPPADRQALLAEGVECYKTLIRGLLDLTDNYRGTDVVVPERVVRKDGEDPYLVVAADKGTATFSDIANGVAAEYGFWLGDAFASGGSAGYDHKKMAITARGAWESVKRHFREMGCDTQTQPFTVVGVGDMSGDVFGNGMLLSPHIRLLGAFNHLHIFIDPDPGDSQTAWAERKRLFELPRSSWTDYDPALISPGGGVFERGAKVIPVSPEMRQAFDLGAETVTPNELIRALLRAPVDLLWFGGIGTFVKAAEENNAAVGDRANDAVRLDASEVRAKVVGEGANLGFTQRGRIAYALAGGRINTDAIDNSGGVDCSDHEVNIKILLNEAVAAGDLTVKQRDQLLVEMTEEVATLVLRDNYLQTQALSVAEAQGRSALGRQARLIRELERAGKLDRALEALPDDEEIAARQERGRGLTRPELAVLLAYSKIFLFEQILASDLPDDPLLVDDLPLYFPRPVAEHFADGIRQHRLRREIAATYATNSFINRLGPTFMMRVEAATGCPPGEIARAYTVARDAFDLRGIWRGIEALDNRVPARVQTEMILEAKALVERATLWLLRRGAHLATGAVELYRPAISELAASIDTLLPRADLDTFRKRQKRLDKEGVPEELSRSVAALDVLAAALDIATIAREQGRPVADVGRVYFLLGARFSLDWLRHAARELPAETPWQREAAAKLTEELLARQSALAAQVLATTEEGVGGKAAIDAWVASRPRLVERTRELLADVRGAGTPDLAMLSVASHQLGQLMG